MPQLGMMEYTTCLVANGMVYDVLVGLSHREYHADFRSSLELWPQHKGTLFASEDPRCWGSGCSNSSSFENPLFPLGSLPKKWVSKWWTAKLLPFENGENDDSPMEWGTRFSDNPYVVKKGVELQIYSYLPRCRGLVLPPLVSGDTLLARFHRCRSCLPFLSFEKLFVFSSCLLECPPR